MPRGAPDWNFMAPQKSKFQLVREQNHFFAMQYLAAGGAGKYNHIQLWNPSDSGVDAYITYLGLWAGGGNKDGLWFLNYALGNYVAHGTNRYSGGTDSSLEKRWEWVTGGIAGYQIGEWYLSTTWLYVEDIHLWLKPGYGLTLRHGVANEASELQVAWWEFISTEV